LAGSLLFLAMGLPAVFSRAEVLDRVVASIGDVAITQSDVEQEYRLERFLDGQWPPLPPESKTLDQARERLVYQKLLLEEETQDLSRDPTLEKTAAEELDGLRKRFSSEQDYRSALQSLHMDETQILTTLIAQQRILRIIEQQLRPTAAPGTNDVESYYHDVFAPEFMRTHGPPVPALTEVEGQIREILAQRKIDQLLASWLEELKPSRRVRFHSF
jgi:glycerophosphoryl diester phosphodiesterase